MQTRFLVEVLVLQAEGLVGSPLSVAVAVVNKLSPRVITSFPKEFALAIGHFSRYADLVAVEVVHGMFGIIPFFVTLRQRLIAVGVSVNVSESAVGFCAVFPLANFLHQVLARPDKLCVALFFALLVQLGFRNPSAQWVIIIHPTFGGVTIMNICLNQPVFQVIGITLRVAISSLAFGEVSETVVSVLLKNKVIKSS